MLVATICAAGATLGVGLVAGGGAPGAETGAAASPGSARATAAMTQLVVESRQERGPISPLLYGVNHRYAYHGFGMWDTALRGPTSRAR